MINAKKAEEIYQKSIEVLKSVQLDNGGCLATPKGKRYPFVYPRDNAICILGFIDAGMLEEAKRGLEFIMKTQRREGAFPQRVDTKGKDASYKPIQIDSTALTIYAFSKYFEKSGDKAFLEKNFPKLIKSGEYIVKNFQKDKNLVFTPNSIFEFPPLEKGLEIWANSTCCAAMKELGKMSKALGKNGKKWTEYNTLIKKGIKKYLWSNRLNAFIKNVRLKESSSVDSNPEASVAGLPDFGVLSDKDKKVKSTMKRIDQELWDKKLGGICRYKKYIGRNNGGYGAWPMFSLMLCRHYIRINDRKNADRHLNWVIKISYKNLLPEHISTTKEFEEYVQDYTDGGVLRPDRLVLIKNARKHPLFKKGIAYSTTPLMWSHAEFIRTWVLYKKVFKKNKKS